ncbi:response regulator [Jannaschia sp. S6380]|uniref:response regulator n=1 Tax=Jannaschia sp. S6380 TaxID=2926408 RepID=UPI001FF5F276|nr:response regulator [Jannaschia sp. S6380]MCK0169082.1 response regulator [Jannaschia sp. S6380]
MGRILVLDDEALIGLDLAMMLEGEGHTISGPHANADAAQSAIAEDPPDAALLDVNLGLGRTSAPVADRLAAAAIPFAFLTGYEQLGEQLEQRFRDRPRLGKPFDRVRIMATLADLLDESAVQRLENRPLAAGKAGR